MLKRLAILGMLLTVAMAPSPMPGQTVKAAAQGGAKGENQSQGKQGTPAPASALVNNPIQSGSAKPNGQPVAGEDKEQTVTIRGLPPVALADKRKTFWDHVLDWGPWIFNFGLVIVGALQVVLLKRTWKTIDRQANIMDTQAKDAKESSAQTFAVFKEQTDNLLISAKAATVTAFAADESSKAANAQIEMVKSKERARISVSASGREIEFPRHILLIQSPSKLLMTAPLAPSMSERKVKSSANRLTTFHTWGTLCPSISQASSGQTVTPLDPR